MDNALLIGLSRQTALRRELDIVANNIANLNTTAFKADGAVFSEYLQNGATGAQFNTPDKRVSFVQDRMSWHDMTQGALQNTGSPLDVAIDGDAYFVVQTARGERYTRNGSFQINSTGQLVTSAGDVVLGDAGPVVFANTDRGITINPDGTIRVQEGLNAVDGGRGRLRLASFANPQSLRKDGASTFVPAEGVQPQPPTQNVRLIQGSIEKSNVRPVIEMTRMIELSRAYTEVAGLLQTQSDMRRSAIEKLADVPA
ncbi:MAG: flagellar basal-body rod protein FlgF [Pseudomonadota bacterium]